MKISFVKYYALLVICSLSAQADELPWSAKSTDRQAGNVLATLEKSSTIASVPAVSMALAQQTSAHSTEQDSPSQAQKTASKEVLPGQVALKLAARPAATQVNQEYWIYDAYVTLHTDSDYDGYYHHFSVDIDVDTQYDHSDVYARLYLGIGEEFREYHTTADFHIDADSANDQLTVETELLSGFYPDDYEILIEVYDAFTNELLAVADGYSDADLYLVSIESQNNEVIYVEPDVVVIEASGGSAGWLAVLLLPFALFRLSKKRISQER